MHELAGCRLMTADGMVGGHVVAYSDGVLRLHVEAAGPVHAGDDPVAVEVLDPVRGECTYRGLVAKVLGTAVDVVVVEATGQRQRRSAARADYHVTCAAVLETDDEPERVVITVLDVSATGLRFSSRRDLTHGAVLVVHLPAPTGVLELRARVLRIEDTRGGYRYGAELLDVDQRTTERLYRLVLQLQREEVRRRAASHG
jgi:hypothetical protein